MPVVATQQLIRKSIDLNGVETAYLDVGRGETIVALHGVPTSSLLFAPVIPHFTNYRLLAPDLLGQGRTATPLTGRLDYSAYARHLRRFLDTVPPPQFHFLLHDLGGVLGLDWAAENIGRLKSLIILSTTVTGSFWVAGVLYAANLILGRRLLRWGMPFTLKRSQGLDSTMGEEWVKPWSRRRLLRGRDHFAGHHLRRVRARLHQVEAPVLVLWGEQDDVFPLRHAAGLVKAFPQAKLRTIRRCGHWSMLDAPEEVAQCVAQFLG